MLTRETIDRLADAAGASLVSLYLPTHRTSPDNSQDPIRLKNLLSRAEQEMIAQGIRRTDAHDLVAPARALLGDTHFWSRQSAGLALFLSSEGMQLFRVPVEVPELAIVNQRFHLKPLLGLLGSEGRAFVLALSLSRLRLFETSREDIRELDLHDIPTNLLDAVGYDWEQRSLQFHTGTGRGRGAMRSAVFHGHGEPGDDDKTEILTFLRVVAGGVEKLLRAGHAPLILAGVEHLTAMFQRATSYRYLLNQVIRGNPDQMTPLELHAVAWPLAARHFARAEAEAAQLCHEAAPGTSNDLPQIIQAAYEGRVESVFVPVGVQKWGRFDPASHAAEIHPSRLPGDRDLFDVVALQSLATGGEVFAVAPGEVPGGGEIAATLRY